MDQPSFDCVGFGPVDFGPVRETLVRAGRSLARFDGRSSLRAASEVAASLETSVASVNSGLQRARATLAAWGFPAQMPA